MPVFTWTYGAQQEQSKSEDNKLPIVRPRCCGLCCLSAHVWARSCGSTGGAWDPTLLVCNYYYALDKICVSVDTSKKPYTLGGGM